MRLARIVETSLALAHTRSRKQKVAALCACIRALDPDEQEIGVSMLAGVLRQGKIGLGHAALHALEVAPVDAPVLDLHEVDRRMSEIAELRGAGSGERRRHALASLLSRATAPEQAFLVHLLVGELRQGALEGLVVEGVAAAAGVDAALVRRALMLSGDLGEVGKAAASGGAESLRAFSLRLFRPVTPMLAQPADTLEQALADLGEASFEWKLDGARIQVHKHEDRVEVYTRRLNPITAAVPEVVELVRALPARSLILDGEAIALRGDGSPHPFQTTMRRFGRKLEVDRLRRELPLHALFFDVLRVDDDTLIDARTDERGRALDDALPAALLVPRLRTASLAAASAFVEEALARGHEGVMAKALDLPYEAGRRGAGWLKLKRAHTLDLVVLAAEWGSGRRRGWLSNLHLGARDPSTGGYVMLGKTFKGLSDELLRWQTERLLALELGRDAHVVHVAPELVVEIAFNDVQQSPHYPGGMALRFARVKRYRSDKRADEADTIDRVREIFAAGRS